MAISGPSGSGKTFTALQIATSLGGPVALVDTEHGSASKYADLFAFDVVNLGAPYHPDRFGEMIGAAVAAGYKALVIDSLTHAWNGPGGIMEIVDQEVARQKTGNSYTAWAKATPIHQNLITKIVSSPIHIIVTMRSKTEYVLEKNEKTGKTAPRKVGMAPVQRDGMEYEFDVWMEMDGDNTGLVQKSRCPELHNAVIPKPGQVLADTLAAWLSIKELPASHATPPVVSTGDGAHGNPPKPAGDAPAKTWAQKIDAAKSYLSGEAPKGDNPWEAAKRRTMERISEWPVPHREEVEYHIESLDRIKHIESLEAAGTVDDTMPEEFR